MSETPKSVGEQMAETQREEAAAREAARPAGDSYTGEPCPVCGRIRVYRRRDGRLQCEKCETIFDPPAAEGDHA